MSYVYTAKTPTTAAATTPTGWWPGWTFPSTYSAAGAYDPWPPGWPQATTAYTLSVTIPADITAGATVETVARILKAGVDTAELNLHLIAISYTRADTGAVVQCKKLVGDSWANGITYQATNYAGIRYGVSQAIYVNTTGLEGVVLVCTATIVSVYPVVTGQASGNIAGAPATYNLLYSGMYYGVAPAAGYPTITSEAAPSSEGYAGKSWSVSPWRCRSFIDATPGPPHIPATPIVTATLNLTLTALTENLESIGNLKIYLAADGALAAAVATYRTAMAAPTVPAACVLLATVSSASLVVGANAIALNAAALNAAAGQDIIFLVTTSGEEAGGIAPYNSGGTTYVSRATLKTSGYVATLVLTF